MAVEADDQLANKSLAQLPLRELGLMVLGIQRANGGSIGAPDGSAVVEPGDRLILYGRDASIRSLDEHGPAARDTAA